MVTQFGLIDELENVQHRATKMIPELKDPPYSKRLKRLKLPTLHHRRNVELKFQKSRSRLDVRKYFSSQWVVNLWNNLPKEVAEAPSMDSFKSRLVTAMQLWSF